MRRVAPAALIVVALLLAGGGQASAQSLRLPTATAPRGRAPVSRWYTRRGSRLCGVGPRWRHDRPRTCSGQTVHAQDTPIEQRRAVLVRVDGTARLHLDAEITIRIDRTPPAVAAVSARPPDYNGWFNHPVTVAFTGADATSGVQSCTSAGYGGPTPRVSCWAGSCQDVAGNVGGGSFPLNYDSTPPAAPHVTATPNDNQVTLRWAPPADAETIEVARITGTGLPALLVPRRRPASFTDRGLKNGKRQRYLITSIDRAGNRAMDRRSAVPTASPLLSPAKGARLEKPPLLVWEAVKRASYYNVQLYRGEREGPEPLAAPRAAPALGDLALRRRPPALRGRPLHLVRLPGLRGALRPALRRAARQEHLPRGRLAARPPRARLSSPASSAAESLPVVQPPEGRRS